MLVGCFVYILEIARIWYASTLTHLFQYYRMWQAFLKTLS